jgi:peptidoglycan/LPS O-acetylase OafA/YrhL
MKKTIPALTGIRYIAAMMVVIHHLTPPTGILLLDHLVRELNAGVTIFFVLSGFLISYRYYEDYSRGLVWKPSYLINRFARIFPMYALVTCFTFVFFFRSDPDHKAVLTAFLMNITLLRGFSEKYMYTGVAQGWTLAVEEVFYLLAPLIFFISKKIPLFLQSLIFLTCGILFLYCTGLMRVNYVLICTFFGRSFEFMCGIYLFFIIKNGSFKPAIRLTAISALLVAALIFIMANLSYPPYQYGIQNPIGLVINNYIAPIAVALLFWSLINERSAFQRILSTKVFEVLGKSSYTLYLIHYGTYSYLVSRYISSNLLIEILILQLSAILAWKFIEEPLNHRIRTLFSKTRDREALLKIVKT